MGTPEGCGTLSPMATTICEAFQGTVAAKGDVLALRTKGGATQISWREYGRRVAKLAGGFPILNGKGAIDKDYVFKN